MKEEVLGESLEKRAASLEKGQTMEETSSSREMDGSLEKRASLGKG